jgi:prevent-host-death family protein
MELRTKTGQILDQAFYRGDEFIVARKGLPLAAIIPYTEYEKWRRFREMFFARLEALQEKFADLSEEEIGQLVQEAIEWARRTPDEAR